MFPASRSRPDVGLRDVGVLAVLSLVLVPPAQLASMILFDSTGLDAVAPDLVFMVVVPALVVAAPVAVLARHRYRRRVALGVVAVQLLAVAVLAAYLLRFYGLCGGPGC